jgi:hypothetical protein
MTRDESAHPEIDRALKRAFADDLPADVEAEMAGQIDRFRERWAGRERKVALAPIRSLRWTAALVKVTLAAVSVLFIVLGLRLRASSPPFSLGSSLASLHWEALLSARITDIRSMECAVHLARPEGPPQEYVIQWISPTETRIRLITAGQETVRTFHHSTPQSSVLELMARPRPEESAAPADLDIELRPVESLLSSGHLRGLLEGKWRPAGTERKDGCDWKLFSVSKAADESISKITVDTCTSLPVRLERESGTGETMEAFFHWVPQAEPAGSLFPRRLSRSAGESTS